MLNYWDSLDDLELYPRGVCGEKLFLLGEEAPAYFSTSTEASSEDSSGATF